MRKLALVSSVIVALLAAVGLFSWSQARATSLKTVRLFEHDTQQANFSLGDKDTGQGNQFVFGGNLLDRAGGTKLGRVGGSCTTVSGTAAAPGDLVCSADFTLPHGQIMTHCFVEAAALFGGKSVPLTILGGTGVYRDAVGDGVFQAANQTDYSYVLRVSSAG